VNADLQTTLYGLSKGVAITLDISDRLLKRGEHEHALQLLRVLEYTNAFPLMRHYDGALPVNNSLLEWRYHEILKNIRLVTPKQVLPVVNQNLSEKLEKAAFHLTELLAEINSSPRPAQHSQ
jgi:hypothetical protein